MTIGLTVLREILLGLSAFMVGIALYIALGDAWRVFRHHDWIAGAYASTTAGIAILASLVGEAIFHALYVPVVWRSLLYTAGLVLASTGLVGVMLDRRTKLLQTWKTPRRRKDDPE